MRKNRVTFLKRTQIYKKSNINVSSLAMMERFK